MLEQGAYLYSFLASEISLAVCDNHDNTFIA